MTIFLSFLRMAWPYLLAASVGFGAAWNLQGLRLDAANNKFDAYKVEQQRLINEAKEKADKQREESEHDFKLKLDKLKADGDIFKRCVASGKCGGMLGVSPNPSPKLSPSGQPNATGADTVSTAGGDAPQVVIDCAQTTLQLNQLQADIEKQ